MIITRLYIKAPCTDSNKVLLQNMDYLKNQEFTIHKGKNSTILVGRIEIHGNACNKLYKEIKTKLEAISVYSEIDSLEPYNELPEIKESEVVGPEYKNVFERPNTIWHVKGIAHKRDIDKIWKPIK